MITLRVQVLDCSKRGNRPWECEDACAYDENQHRLAIADGASDAFESRRWAKALVDAFIRTPPSRFRPEAVLRWLDPLIQDWEKGIQWDQLPWYAEEKARRGSFSTMLGVIFPPPRRLQKHRATPAGHWFAMAIGDACLFQIRGDEVIVRFPLNHFRDFGTAPPLVSTRSEYNRRSLEKLRCRTGDCQPGDLLLLATDALAAWFLHSVEVGQKPWKTLVGLTASEFPELVKRLRQDGAMRNDDVTVLLVRVDENDHEGRQLKSG